MRGYSKRALVANTLTSEEKDMRAYYARIQPFKVLLRGSKMLTEHQRNTLWGQAKAGDLEGAMKGYKKLLSVR